MIDKKETVGPIVIDANKGRALPYHIGQHCIPRKPSKEPILRYNLHNTGEYSLANKRLENKRIYAFMRLLQSTHIAHTIGTATQQYALVA